MCYVLKYHHSSAKDNQKMWAAFHKARTTPFYTSKFEAINSNATAINVDSFNPQNIFILFNLSSISLDSLDNEVNILLATHTATTKESSSIRRVCVVTCFWIHKGWSVG